MTSDAVWSSEIRLKFDCISIFCRVLTVISQVRFYSHFFIQRRSVKQWNFFGLKFDWNRPKFNWSSTVFWNLMTPFSWSFFNNMPLLSELQCESVKMAKISSTFNCIFVFLCHFWQRNPTFHSIFSSIVSYMYVSVYYHYSLSYPTNEMYNPLSCIILESFMTRNCIITLILYVFVTVPVTVTW